MNAATDLFTAIDAADDAQVEHILALEPEIASSRDEDGVSAVMHALYRGHRNVAESVAARLQDVDVFEAASLGRVGDVIRLVAADHALATAWSVDGFTPLHFAAFFGDGATAKALLSAGADPDLRSENEFAVMPLHSAVAGRRHDVVEALVAAGADVNVTQRHGYTPLLGAAENGDAETVELLLGAGADPRATTDDGRSAGDVARAGGHDTLAARLERAGGGASATSA
jgi:ankyrin repeat protein